MTSKLRSWWQSIKKHWVIASAMTIAIVFVLMVYAGYQFGWEWTGFNAHIGPNVQQYQPTKTLWDWLNLLGVLAIPMVVGLGAAWYTAQQGKANERANADNQRETALQAYIDNMSELLLKEGLGGPSPKDEVRTIARVRTITLLFQLDARRIGYVFTFLREAGLMSKKSESNILSLRRADLRKINLSQASLSEVNLSGAILNQANLSGADLNVANLNQAFLVGANLSFANLIETNLSFAYLMRADLSGADLSEADLSEADLSGATVTQDQLEKAQSLRGATMPDKSKHS